MTWLVLSVGYIVLASAAVAWVVRKSRPSHESGKETSVGEVARDLAELRSLFLETIADVAEAQRRVEENQQRVGLMASHTRDGLTDLAEKVGRDVDSLRRQLDQVQLESWFASGVAPTDRR